MCAVSEKYSPLIHGVCAVCRDTNNAISGPDPETRKRMSVEIDAIFEKYSEHGRDQFDCLLLFSGGKDSIYLLHVLKTRFPNLRILLLFIDNTFLPLQALTNATQVAAKLRVPLTTIQPDPRFYEKVFRHAFLNLGQRESSVVVDQFDGDLHGDIARNFAVRHSIPLIADGAQTVQVERYIGIQNYETLRSFEENKRTHLAGFQLDTFLNADDLAHFWDGTKWPKKSIPRMIFPLYAWEYEEKNVIETIQKLGLLSKKKLSPLATNHQLLPLMGAVDIARLGYSSYDPEFANLIRTGGADKKFWQSILEMQEYVMKKNRFVKNSIDTGLKRLSLTRKDLDLPE
jgi:hypothetical protein